MSSIILRTGQRGKVLELKTGIDLTLSTARIVRVQHEGSAAVEITGVPFDPEDPANLLFTIEAGHFDAVGVYQVEIEVQFDSGAKVIRCDEDITIEVNELGEDAP